jgi:hypothetical protein
LREIPARTVDYAAARGAATVDSRGVTCCIAASGPGGRTI